MKLLDLLNITALSKADWVDPASFQHLVPRYEAMTERFIAGAASRK